MRTIKNVHGNTVDFLGQEIVAGRYRQAQSFPTEPVLCEQLGISRTVLRESVKSLVAKGLLSTGPKVGTRVLPAEQWNWFDPDVIAWQARAGFSVELVHDLQDLRLVVEPAAVRLAAERRTDEDIAQIEDAFAGMCRAVAEGGDYVRWDLLFHQGLLQATHNRIWIHMDKALGALLRTSFELSTKRKHGTRDSLPMHRAVLDQVIARNPAGAEHAMRVLINSAHHDIDLVLSTRRRLPRMAQSPIPLKAAASPSGIPTNPFTFLHPSSTIPITTKETLR